MEPKTIHFKWSYQRAYQGRPAWPIECYSVESNEHPYGYYMHDHSFTEQWSEISYAVLKLSQCFRFQGGSMHIVKAWNVRVLFITSWADPTMECSPHPAELALTNLKCLHDSSGSMISRRTLDKAAIFVKCGILPELVGKWYTRPPCTNSGLPTEEVNTDSPISTRALSSTRSRICRFKAYS
jgi:hypothetical protein